MTEPVKRYYVSTYGGIGTPRLVEMSEQYQRETGALGLIKGEDYARLEQECERLREERDSFQRVGIRTMEERDATLKQVEGLRGALEKAALAMWNSEANMDNEAAEAEVALSDAALLAEPCAPTK